jgi:biopolymer transport protein ExbB
VSAIVSRVQDGDADGARAVALKARGPASHVMVAGIDALTKSDEEREAAMESALLAEAPHLERSLSLLAALAGVAPLLGLLGTVSGIIRTFDTISVAGTSNPRLLSGGISEALITTQLGLIVAIPLLLAHAWLRHWAARREAMLEYNAIQVFGASAEDQGVDA